MNENIISVQHEARMEAIIGMRLSRTVTCDTRPRDSALAVRIGRLKPNKQLRNIFLAEIMLDTVRQSNEQERIWTVFRNMTQRAIIGHITRKVCIQRIDGGRDMSALAGYLSRDALNRSLGHR